MSLVCTACGFRPAKPEQEPPPRPTKKKLQVANGKCTHCGRTGTVVEVDDEDEEEGE
jgi:hypothetical protein